MPDYGPDHPEGNCRHDDEWLKVAFEWNGQKGIYDGQNEIDSDRHLPRIVTSLGGPAADIELHSRVFSGDQFWEIVFQDIYLD